MTFITSVYEGRPWYPRRLKTGVIYKGDEDDESESVYTDLVEARIFLRQFIQETVASEPGGPVNNYIHQSAE